MRRVLLPHHISQDPAPAGSVVHQFGGQSMGTGWTVRVAALLSERMLDDVQRGLQQRLDEVVGQMSHWEASSDLGRFNRAPAGSWHELPADFCKVLAYGLDVARDAGGAYDPCAGALVNLWGFGPERRHDQPGFVVPDAQQVALARARHARARVQLDRDARRALQPGGVQLDLSAIAKGYAIDKLALYLEARGLHHYLVEVGGELRGGGVKPDGQPWWVELEQAAPDAPLDELVLALHGLAVATSGDYRRYFESDERRYSHTIDPRSGAPIDNQLASVTVVHAQCMAADAWSTALTVLGPDAGLALAEKLGLAARLVTRTAHGYEEHMSSHLRAMLE